MSWPMLMDAEESGRYLMLSETSFRRVAAANGIAPVEIGIADARWLKCDLKAWAKSRSRRPLVPPADDAANDNFTAEAALARVRAASKAHK